MSLNIKKQTIELFLSFLLFGIISSIRQNNLEPTLSATSVNTFSKNKSALSKRISS